MMLLPSSDCQRNLGIIRLPSLAQSVTKAYIFLKYLCQNIGQFSLCFLERHKVSGEHLCRLPCNLYANGGAGSGCTIACVLQVQWHTCDQLMMTTGSGKGALGRTTTFGSCHIGKNIMTHARTMSSLSSSPFCACTGCTSG